MTQLDSSNQTPLPLYRHRKAHEWGLAILAWERGPRRAYQFEDGKLRVFKKGYYEMLEEVDAPADRAAKVVAELERKLGNAPAERIGTPRNPRPELSLEDQVRVFAIQQPNGFGGATWQTKCRGVEVARRLKRHREPAINDARERLSEAAIDAAIAEDRASDIHAAAMKILDAVDVVNASQLEPLRALPESRHISFVTALRELLWGDGNYDLRFERLVATLALTAKRGPSWQLATALPALVHPDQQVCVRPSTFKTQALYMAPRLTYAATPNASLYARYVDMARSVAARLADAGIPPADLWDVYDFMVDTLKPSAAKLLQH